MLGVPSKRHQSWLQGQQQSAGVGSTAGVKGSRVPPWPLPPIYPFPVAFLPACSNTAHQSIFSNGDFTDLITQSLLPRLVTHLSHSLSMSLGSRTPGDGICGTSTGRLGSAGPSASYFCLWVIISRHFRNISEPNQIYSPMGGTEKIYFSPSSSPYERKLEHRPETGAGVSQ